MNPMVTVTGFWDAFVTKIAVFLPNLFFSIAILSARLGDLQRDQKNRRASAQALPVRFAGGARRYQADSRKGRHQAGAFRNHRAAGFLVSFSDRDRDDAGDAQLERRHRYLAHDLSLHSQDCSGFSDVDPRALFREFFGNA